MQLSFEPGGVRQGRRAAAMIGSGRRQRGVSLTELMIAITLGLLVTTGVIALFSSNSSMRNEIERTGRRLENGQYALRTITHDLANAGYYAEYDPTVQPRLPVPVGKPDPCVTTPADLVDALPLPVQGYDGGTGIAATTCQGGPAILSDLKAGTDILVVRRASACISGSADCPAAPAGTYTYFQASLCDTQLSSGVATNFFNLDTNTDNLTRTKRDCATLADVHRYHTHIYFIANNDAPGDGIPTLKRAELGPPPASCTTQVGGFCVVPVAEGVEDMQVEYGIDTTAPTPDGVPDVFTSSPDVYAASLATPCPAASASPSTIACTEYWQRVVTADVHLLVRNTEQSSATDTKTYTLGSNAPLGPFNDRYKRHIYETVVRLNNSAVRY